MMMTSMAAGGGGGESNNGTMIDDGGELEKFGAGVGAGYDNHHPTTRNKTTTKTKKKSSTVANKGNTKKTSTKGATTTKTKTVTPENDSEIDKPVTSATTRTTTTPPQISPVEMVHGNEKDEDHEEESERDESMEMNSESSSSSSSSEGNGGDGEYGNSSPTQPEPLGITTIEFTTSTAIDVHERRKADRDRDRDRTQDTGGFWFAPSSVHTDEAEEFSSSDDDVTTDDEDEFLFAGISGGSGVIGGYGREKQRSYHSNTSSLASSWRKEYARKRALNLLTIEDDVEYTQSRLSRRSLVEENIIGKMMIEDDPPRNIEVQADETNHSSIHSVSFHDDVRDSKHIHMFGGRSDIGRDSSHHELIGGSTLGSSIHDQSKKKRKSSRNKNVDSRHSQGVFSVSSLPREDAAVLQTVLASMSDASSDEESFALDGPLSKHDKTWEYRMKAAQVVDPSFAVNNEVEKEEEIEGSTRVDLRRRTVDVSDVDIEQNAGQVTEERKVDIYNVGYNDKEINNKDTKDEGDQEDDPDDGQVEQSSSDIGDVEAPVLPHESFKSTRSDIDPPKQKSSMKRDKRRELRRELEAQASAQFADKDKYTKKRLRDSIRRKSSRKVSIRERKEGKQDEENNRSMTIDNLTASQIPMGDDLQKSSKSVPQNSATSRLTEDRNDYDGDMAGKQVKKKGLVENISDVVFSYWFVFFMSVMIFLLFIAVIVIFAYFVKGRQE
mmetsp:Transcript_22527/g.53203  ORF Transcript_22527/g.53203 Transcript_22527/m.53203 type:complete len:722 (-) Transcript_22527:1150-3315(-)